MSSRSLSIQKAFGALVRERRLQLGLTQEDLADQVGMFRTYASRIETGHANPTLTMVDALATALGLDLSDLFQTPGKAKPIAGVSAAGARRSRGRVR